MPKPQEPATLLESSDVARLLGVGPAQVRYLARVGNLRPEYVTPRGVRLYLANTVLRFAAQRRGAAQ